MDSKLTSFVLFGILACVFGVNSAPMNTTTAPANSTNCPFPCTQGGQHFCYPIPCPLPPCADPVTDKGACCPHCPTGPNCDIKGRIVPQGGNTIFNGQFCECRQGGDSHSALVICSRCFDLNLGGVGKRSCV